MPSYAAVAERADIVILCHGRPDLARTAAAVGTHARIVVSTVADTPLEVVRHAYPGRPVYRIAVNSAAQIRRGVTVLAKGPAQPEDHVLQLLLERLGSVITVDDALVDTAAAVLDGVETDCIDAVARSRRYERSHLPSTRWKGFWRAEGSQPIRKGSRVAPSSSIQTALVSVNSCIASRPLSRPQPLSPTPPNGTCGATTR